jgi:hypothetical protein
MLDQPIAAFRTLPEVAGPAPRRAALVIGRVDLAAGAQEQLGSNSRSCDCLFAKGPGFSAVI